MLFWKKAQENQEVQQELFQHHKELELLKTKVEGMADEWKTYRRKLEANMGEFELVVADAKAKIKQKSDYLSNKERADPYKEALRRKVLGKNFYPKELNTQPPAP